MDRDEKILLEATIDGFLENAKDEYFNSLEKYSDFNSYHEAYAVIKEEVDELWDCIKSQKSIKEGPMAVAIENEAKQITAMCIKLIVSCCHG